MSSTPVRLAPLPRSALAEARALLVRAMPHDRIDLVAEEKLFGDDGARSGTATGAFADERLVGVLAQAGRFVKILAVDAEHRRSGVGHQLLTFATQASSATLRVGDHPGNYLSPGVDARYTESIAFLRAHRFIERARVENLRVPMADNPLVSTRRAAALEAEVTAQGYRLGRPNALELPVVLAMIGREFAPVWANEARHAASGPRHALFCAFAPDGSPVAFAAADGNNQGLGWFGPAGTLPAHRGRRLGEALLLSCLLAVDGLPEAGVIAWIGPRAFYARAAGAVDDRCFVQMERVA